MPRLDRGLGIVLGLVDEGDLGRERQLGLLAAGQRVERLVGVGLDQIVRRDGGERADQPALGEVDQPAGLVRVDEVGEAQGLERVPRDISRSIT